MATDVSGPFHGSSEIPSIDESKKLEFKYESSAFKLKFTKSRDPLFEKYSGEIWPLGSTAAPEISRTDQ
jgi:hypothetical protein